MARKRLPASGHAVVANPATGKMDSTWYKMQKRQAREAVTAEETATTTTTNVTTLSSDSRGAFIEYPDAKDYTLWQRIPFAGTIDRTTVKTSAGTATVTVKVNTTAVGGSAHSASSAEESIARTTTNTFAAGDDFVVTVASVSSAENLAVSIDFTRTMA
jgi:hypothetical protein